MPTEEKRPIVIRLEPDVATALRLHVAELSTSAQGFVEGLIRRALPPRLVEQLETLTRQA